MNTEFKKYIADLEESFQQLLSMKPAKVASLPKDMPKRGIYLFSEGEQHLYVGRSTGIRQRLQRHCRPSSKHNSAAFAFRIAREAVGKTRATYTPDGSREDLESDPEFSKAFKEAKERIRKMDVRFVGEGTSLKQALLEIYSAVSLNTPYNDFDTH